MATLARMVTELGLDASDYHRGLGQAEQKAQGFGSRVGGFLGRAFEFATGGVIEQGFTNLIGNFGSAASAGFGFNNSMEIVSAQLNAFTKNGEVTAGILDMIKTRAASTPFAFDEMARAAAGLLPASKASGVGLESLIQKAEILAASNPAEGLEGAAFALREAVSGDYVSLMERFNIPRTMINQLKAEGLPALEIVGRAMESMGLDASLVGNLAATASGRWSTFKDTLVNVAATATAGLFTGWSSGLEVANTWLTANTASIQAFAQSVGTTLTAALQTVIGFVQGSLVPAFMSIYEIVMLLATRDFRGGIFGLAEDSPIIAGLFILRDTVAGLWRLISDNFMPIMVGLGAVLASIIVPALFSAGAAAIAGGIALAAMLAPLLAIGAAAATLYIAWTENWGGIQQITLGFLEQFAPAWEAFLGLLATGWDMVSMVAEAFGEGGLGLAFATLMEGLPGLTASFLTFAETLGTILLGLGEQFVAWIGPMIPVALEALGTLGTALYTWVVEQGPILLEQLLAWGQAFIGWVAPMIPPALEALGTFVTGIVAWVMAQAPVLLEQLLTWGQAFVDWIAPFIPPALAALGTLVSGIWSWIVAQAPGFVQQLVAWGQSFVAWIGPMIPSVLAQIAQLGTALYNWISAQAGPILARFAAWGQSFIAWVGPATVQFLAEWPGMLSRFLDWIGSAAGPILAQLATWSVSFVSWIIPMIPELLLGLAGLVIAITVFIAETALVLVSKLIEWGLAFASWIGSTAIPKLLEGLGTLYNEVVGWIAGAAGTLMAEAVILGTSLIDGIISGIGDIASLVKDTIVGGIQGGIAGVKSFFGIKSPATHPQVTGVGDGLAMGIAKGFVGGMTKAQREMVDAAAETMSKVAAAVSATIDALTKLQGYTGGALFGDIVSSFAADTEAVIRALMGVAVKFKASGVKAASEFAEGAGKVMSLVGSGVDALEKLAEWGGVRLSGQLLQELVAGVSLIVIQIQEAAEGFAQEGLTAAGVFAEGVTKVLSVIGPAVDALARLGDFRGGALNPRSLQSLVAGVSTIVIQIEEAAEAFSREGLDAATYFSEQGGRIIGIIAPALEAITALGTADQISVDAFRLQGLLGGVTTIIIQIQEAAEAFTRDGLSAALEFSEGAGRVLALVGDAIGAFVALEEFHAVPEGVLEELAGAITRTVELMIDVANGIDGEMLEAASAFADGAGSVIGLVADAIEPFLELQDYKGVPEEVMIQVAADIHRAVYWMGIIAQGIEETGLEAARAFSEGLGEVFDMMTSAVDLLQALREYEGVPPERFEAFANDFNLAVEYSLIIGERAEFMADYSIRWLRWVKQFADNYKNAVKAIADLPEMPKYPNMPTPPSSGGGGGGGGVPGAAFGVQNWRGGLLQVHADEMIQLPRGTDVIPSHRISAMVPAMGGGTTVQNTIGRVDSDFLVERVVQRTVEVLDQRSRRSRGGRG